jgi:hypothetical protein
MYEGHFELVLISVLLLPSSFPQASAEIECNILRSDQEGKVIE